ncbi:hypothetical protein DL98DRAFT_529930 [Cadophora sp. DSE1049]|nr:hypothetical protein DL98DRAFT_529930 [Cadophora sp. DSE1049]
MTCLKQAPFILDNSILDYIPNRAPSSPRPHLSDIESHFGSPALVSCFAAELSLQVLECMDLETQKDMTTSVSGKRIQSKIRIPRIEITGPDGENGSAPCIELTGNDDEEMSHEEEVKIMMDVQVVSPSSSSPSVPTIQIFPPTPPPAAPPAPPAPPATSLSQQNIPATAHPSPHSAVRPRTEIRDRARYIAKKARARARETAEPYTSRSANAIKSSIPSSSNTPGTGNVCPSIIEEREVLVIPGELSLLLVAPGICGRCSSTDKEYTRFMTNTYEDNIAARIAGSQPEKKMRQRIGQIHDRSEQNANIKLETKINRRLLAEPTRQEICAQATDRYPGTIRIKTATLKAFISTKHYQTRDTSQPVPAQLSQTKEKGREALVIPNRRGSRPPRDEGRNEKAGPNNRERSKPDAQLRSNEQPVPRANKGKFPGLPGPPGLPVQIDAQEGKDNSPHLGTPGKQRTRLPGLPGLPFPEFWRKLRKFSASPT